MEYIYLNDGNRMPRMGLGTYGLKGYRGTRSIIDAIQTGYRLIDTAYNYENEGSVGQALAQTSVPRESLFVTSKLPGRYHGYDQALIAIQESLARLDLDVLDLYLIHWPNPLKDQYVEAWRALIDAQKWGLVRSIGVCNFMPEHIERLIAETGIAPSVNQIELHPYFNQEAQREFDRRNGIVTQSWSPLGRGSGILQETLISNLAQQYGKSPAQIVLRWHLHLGLVPIPKSSSAKRQAENFDIFDFELNENDMELLNGLTKEDGRLQQQDPRYYEEF